MSFTRYLLFLPLLLPLVADAAPDLRAQRFVDVDADGDEDGLRLDFDALVVEEETGAGTVVRRYLPDESGEDEYTAFEVVDIDGDGAPDVLAVGENNLFGRDCALARWDNDGEGGFVWSRVTIGSYGWSCDDLALGDVDEDGELDVVAAEVADGGVHVFRRAGGTYVAATVPGFAPSCPEFTRTVALADVDADGRADLLCGTRAPLGSRVELRVQRHGVAAQELILAAPPATLVAATGAAVWIDADGDADLDVRVDVRLSTGAFARAVALNDGRGGFGALVLR